jgi:hypothetical protein
MQEVTSSYFNYQSVTIFPKSINSLNLSSSKPIQPNIPINNLSIKNTNTFAPR